MSRVLSPPNYLTQTGILLDNPLASSFNDPATGTKADDSTRLFGGLSNSVKMTPPVYVSSTTNITIKKALDVAADISGYETLQFAFYFESQDDVTELDGSGINVILYLSDQASGAGSVFYTTPFNHQVGEGWNFVTLNADDFLGGTLDITNVAWMQMVIQDTGAASGFSVNYGGLWSGYRQRAKLTISLDDNYDDHYVEAFSYMQPLGLKGCCLINSTHVDGVGYCTTAQLQEMYDAGWDMVNHASTHDGMVLSPDWDADVQAGKDFIEANSWTRAATVFGPPGGEYTSSGTDVLKSKNYNFMRGIHSGYANFSQGLVTQYNFPSYVLQNTVTVQNGKDYVDDLIRKGACGGLYFHQLEAASGGNIWAIANFQEIMDYLELRVRRGEIDVVTFSELQSGTKV